MERYLWCILSVSISVLFFPSFVNGRATLGEIQVSGADERSSISISLPEAQMARLHPIALSASGTDFVTSYLLNAQLLLGLPANLSQQHIIVSQADYVKTHDLAGLSVVNGKISTVDPTETPVPTKQVLQDTVTPAQVPAQMESAVNVTSMPDDNSSADNPSGNVQIDGGTPNASDELLRLINELLGQEPDVGDFPIGWATVILAMATVISAIASLISWFTNKKGNELSDPKPRVRDFPIGWATIILAISTIFAAWIG